MLLITALAAAVLAGQSPQDNPRRGKFLIWKDDFSEKGLPDPDRWGYERGLVRNHEAQYYTVNRLDNAHVENHQLTIEARQEPFETATCTSAALESKESWDHGYFEIKAKIPTGKGTWPAIWFLGDSIRKKGAEFVGWPKCGEIDLMENVGFDPDKVHFNVHVEKSSQAANSVSSHNITVPEASKGWHIYGLNYQPHRLDFYFDYKRVMSYIDDGKGESSWPFNKPQFVILNLAIGGDWGGQQGVDPKIFPSKFEVQYVRVYQERGK